jgi:hypothetical protein
LSESANPSETGKVGYASPPLHSRFQPGVSPNPGGKPVKARNRLQGAFLKALADDFEEEGKSAIEACRLSEPGVYLRVIASLMPKEIEVIRQFEDLTDEQLAAAVLAARSLATESADVPVDPRAGDGGQGGAQQAQALPALSEAG